MTLDSQLSQQAAAYAQEIANLGQLKHASNLNGMGENLAMYCGSSVADYKGDIPVTQWYVLSIVMRVS